MRIDWRPAKLLCGPCQILAHQAQGAFDTLMIAGPPMSAFARGLQVPDLNNVAHIASLLSPSSGLAFHYPNRATRASAGGMASSPQARPSSHFCKDV